MIRECHGKVTELYEVFFLQACCAIHEAFIPGSFCAFSALLYVRTYTTFRLLLWILFPEICSNGIYLREVSTGNAFFSSDKCSRPERVCPSVVKPKIEGEIPPCETHADFRFFSAGRCAFGTILQGHTLFCPIQISAREIRLLSPNSHIGKLSLVRTVSVSGHAFCFVRTCKCSFLKEKEHCLVLRRSFSCCPASGGCWAVRVRA